MIVIIGGTHHNTLSMVKCLGQKGHKVDVILCGKQDKESYVIKSKYINKSYQVNDALEALKIIQKNYQESCIIPCADDIASLLSDNTRFFMDKQKQVELAKQCGLKVPESKLLNVGFLPYENDTFPCLVKPLESIQGGKRIDICYDLDELGNVLQGYEEGDKVQIQEFIQRDCEIVVDGVAIGGKVIIPGCVEKYRDVKGGTTFSQTHPITFIPVKICQAIKKMMASISYEGLFGVELIISNGEYYFIEANLRNDATTYSLAVAGVNLPYIYYLANKGKDYTQEVNKPVREIYSMVENRDFGFVKMRQLSLLTWIKDYRKCECKYFYDKNDMGPYKAMKKTMVNGIKNSFLKLIKFGKA